MAAEVEDVFLPFPPTLHLARNAKSTVLQGSVAAVRASGHEQDYLRHLAPANQQVLLQAVAGTWIPIEVAAAHYEACDAAGFGVDEAFANGRRTFDQTGQVIFGTVLKMAKAAGVTPWTLLEQLQRFWERGYDGGGVQVVRQGPKEARIHIVKCRLFESPYYRAALRGVVTSAMELFCTKVYVTEKAGPRPFGTVTYRQQWA
jgi:hypothetical protein